MIENIRKSTKRAFWSGLLSVAVLSNLTAAHAAQTLTIGSAGGQYDECLKKNITDDWSKVSGNTVVYGTPYYNMGAWKVQQETGKTEWDVSLASGNQAQELMKNGWLSPIDQNILKADGDLIDYPNLTLNKDGKLYSLPSEISGNVIAFSTKAFPNDGPSTWKDVFDLKKYPGKRLFSNRVSEYGTLEVALLADGVDPKQLYPLDVPRALKKLDTIKDSILWYESGAQQVSLLQQGDAVTGLAWDGRIKAMMEAKSPVSYVKQNALTKVDFWVLPKGGNVTLGQEFLKYATSAKVQANFLVCMGYGSGFKDVYKNIPETAATTLRPETVGTTIAWNASYWATHAQDVTKVFNDWLTK